MRNAWLAKILAVGITIILLSMALMRIGFLVQERQEYQRQAVESVQQGIAGAQTLVGPVLVRQCLEEWTVVSGVGKTKRTENMRRDIVLRAVPTRLEVRAQSTTDLRYRGLFKVNGYVTRLNLKADWDEFANLLPLRENAGSKLTCKPVAMWFSTSDVRGLRSAQLKVTGQPVAVKPGTGQEAYASGWHAELSSFAADASVPADSLKAEISLDLLGTAQLSVVPVAQSTQWSLQSDWPHPSFAGRFLPNRREVSERGFTAHWELGALATTAPREVLRDAPVCAAELNPKPCLDTLTVNFVDPVNPYTLTDRAIKYGMLFVLLTFVAVALAETLARGRVRRVHPVQYALVGATLCLFFLLLLSISEHLHFEWAYALASGACAVLLSYYARHMLGRTRDGVLFGAGMAALYGLVYVLLVQEQAALVVGSVGLFAVLGLVMLLTRHVDWYRLLPNPASLANSAAPATSATPSYPADVASGAGAAGAAALAPVRSGPSPSAPLPSP
jgi:inner membrane protein